MTRSSLNPMLGILGISTQPPVNGKLIADVLFPLKKSVEIVVVKCCHFTYKQAPSFCFSTREKPVKATFWTAISF